MSPDSAQVTITADGSDRPAWLFPVPGATTWAIHVHGIHSSRTAVLRGVPDTLDAGMTSLVIGYRGDVEDDRGLPATFGSDEWHDLDAAMRYAVDHGAERLVLVGWSMGATIAMHAASDSALRDRVDAMVLVCPALDWFTALRWGAVKAGFPGFLGVLGAGALTLPGLSRLAGMRTPIPPRTDATAAAGRGPAARDPQRRRPGRADRRLAALRRGGGTGGDPGGGRVLSARLGDEPGPGPVPRVGAPVPRTRGGTVGGCGRGRVHGARRHRQLTRRPPTEASASPVSCGRLPGRATRRGPRPPRHGSSRCRPRAAPPSYTRTVTSES
ncbi:alpha/beta fold hydrolase [Curtobacterium sp. MCJR17_043]|uniref:alpha/beta hydrolase family protein n=1 Tax=Curtobacterium sp. MCJR17_043 TaxID=2175660 RepID=UPI0032E91827